MLNMETVWKTGETEKEEYAKNLTHHQSHHLPAVLAAQRKKTQMFIFSIVQKYTLGAETKRCGDCMKPCTHSCAHWQGQAPIKSKTVAAVLTIFLPPRKNMHAAPKLISAVGKTQCDVNFSGGEKKHNTHLISYLSWMVKLFVCANHEELCSPFCLDFLSSVKRLINDLEPGSWPVPR